MEQRRIGYEEDQRHAELIIKLMGLTEKNTQPSHRESSGKAQSNEKGIGDELLAPTDATVYRATVARGNNLSQDRTDIRFAVKDLSRGMSQPRGRDMTAMGRLARYLIGRTRVVQKFVKQGKQKCIEG